jgi:hypothetical protein
MVFIKEEPIGTDTHTLLWMTSTSTSNQASTGNLITLIKKSMDSVIVLMEAMLMLVNLQDQLSGSIIIVLTSMVAMFALIIL